MFEKSFIVTIAEKDGREQDPKNGIGVQHEDLFEAFSGAMIQYIVRSEKICLDSLGEDISTDYAEKLTKYVKSLKKSFLKALEGLNL